MSEMIDRVSKAIAAKMAPGLIGERQVTVAEIARAAVEAMRLPTDEMVDAARPYYSHDPRYIDDASKDIFSAMIDAAANEETSWRVS